MTESMDKSMDETVTTCNNSNETVVLENSPFPRLSDIENNADDTLDQPLLTASRARVCVCMSVPFSCYCRIILAFGLLIFVIVFVVINGIK